MTHRNAVPPDRNDTTRRELALAETVRSACARVAREAYNDAAIQGLCSEGAAEVASGAIAALDLAPLIARATRPDPDAR